MKNSYEILYDSKTRIEFKRGVICKISIKKKKICLQFCFHIGVERCIHRFISFQTFIYPGESLEIN